MSKLTQLINRTPCEGVFENSYKPRWFNALGPSRCTRCWPRGCSHCQSRGCISRQSARCHHICSTHQIPECAISGTPSQQNSTHHRTLESPIPSSRGYHNPRPGHDAHERTSERRHLQRPSNPQPTTPRPGSTSSGCCHVHPTHPTSAGSAQCRRIHGSRRSKHFGIARAAQLVRYRELTSGTGDIRGQRFPSKCVATGVELSTYILTVCHFVSLKSRR